MHETKKKDFLVCSYAVMTIECEARSKSIKASSCPEYINTYVCDVEFVVAKLINYDDFFEKGSDYL